MLAIYDVIGKYVQQLFSHCQIDIYMYNIVVSFALFSLVLCPTLPVSFIDCSFGFL
jgi:hypothetical protein